MAEIHFAPLQGFTDLAYRNAHFQFIGHADYYYIPFFSVDDRLIINPDSFCKDLFNKTIPQVLPANLDELKVLFRFVHENHFSAVNINLGCPYPMVTRKGRGAALIQNPDLVSDMVRYISEHSDIAISLKTRLGISDAEEIFKLLDRISSEKIKTIIIHPRTAKQLYKGNASPEVFRQCKELFPQIDMIYNGDINSFEDYSKLKGLIQGQNRWMLGRGLLSNPLLGWQIKNDINNLPEDYSDILNSFVFHLIENIEKDSNDKWHAHNRIKSQFIYLSNLFPAQRKVFKSIKKSKSMIEVKEILKAENNKMKRWMG